MQSDSDILLLDTHVWIWLANGDERLVSSRALPMIEQAASRDAARISIMSVWELGMLTAKGRLELRMPAVEWVHRSLARPGIALLGLNPAITLDSTSLPGRLPGDPVDRLLIATARAHRATLVTRDERILRYGDAKHVKVLRA